MVAFPQDSISLYARTQPNRRAAIELVTGQKWSFGQLDQEVLEVMASLVNQGCVCGDRVAVLARNSVRLVVLHFACARLGLIFVPLNWRLSSAELDTLVALSDPSICLVDDASKPALNDASNFHSLEEFFSNKAPRQLVAHRPVESIDVDLDRASLMLFTSGTSGASKGVLLSERNLSITATGFSMLTAVTADSCFLCEAPMFHVIGLVTNVRPVLQQGGCIVVSDGYVPERTLACFDNPELGITHYVGVPQMIEGFREQPNFNIESLRKLTALVTGGAAHDSRDVLAWFEDGVSLTSGYGMSEAGTILGMSTDISVARKKIGSAGLPAPGVELKLVDDKGQDCTGKGTGELYVRGQNTFIGYWRNNQLTKDTYTEDGWLKTGDIAHCDEEGFVWIVDRKKDMFISGGENVYPAEIEALLTDYPGIEELAVVGVSDSKWGEVGCLVVVPSIDHNPNFTDIKEALASSLASYKIPKKLAITFAMPRTSTGKVKKAILKEQIESGLLDITN